PTLPPAAKRRRNPPPRRRAKPIPKRPTSDRQRPSADSPARYSFRIPMICSSVYRLFRAVRLISDERTLTLSRGHFRGCRSVDARSPSLRANLGRFIFDRQFLAATKIRDKETKN